jgi:hypothetical protein
VDPFGDFPNDKRRRIPSIVVKRYEIKWGALWKEHVKGKPDPTVDSYGHWWIEIDGAESYGWWPIKRLEGLKETIKGVGGELNGRTAFGGTWTRDPHHGDKGEREFTAVFDPYGKLEFGRGRDNPCCIASDEEIKDCLRDFAKKYKGNWSYPWGTSCRSFQVKQMHSCCLISWENPLTK